MLLIRWILTAVLGGMALLLDVGNVVLRILAQKRERHMSPVPLFGALLGASTLGLVVHSLEMIAGRES
jgi:hypothetical protein